MTDIENYPGEAIDACEFAERWAQNVGRLDAEQLATMEALFPVGGVAADAPPDVRDLWRGVCKALGAPYITVEPMRIVADWRACFGPSAVAGADPVAIALARAAGRGEGLQRFTADDRKGKPVTQAVILVNPGVDPKPIVAFLFTAPREAL